MTRAIDVAAYILQQRGPMSTMKLQKLVYYSQAWSLVWDDEPIFEERIEAWANGPVTRELWDAHRGSYRAEPGSLRTPASLATANAKALTKAQAETVDAVLSYYGDRTAQWLSDLTHLEQPWKQARDRDSLQPGERGSPEILLEDMLEYYSSIPPEEDVQEGP